MKNKIIFFTIFICLISCQQNEQKKTLDDPLIAIENDSVKTESIPPNNSLPKDLSPLSDTLMLKLKMDSATSHLTIPVLITSGKELFAALSSDDKNANIRISQVGLPDSTFDGPFGKDLHHEMMGPGNYKIIIGENMMAGDRWKGDFVLRVWVK
ncbi:MAG: hypothetical protein ABIR50_00370 [Ginsengibacter sp.]